MGILDLIFPKRCVNCRKFGAYVCPDCFVYISFDVLPICLVCNRQSYTSLTHERCEGRYVIDGTFASVVFGRVVRKLMYQFKYKPYLHNLHTFITELFYEGLIQKEAFFKIERPDAFLVPIPLHVTKLKQRGYNQAELLAKGIGERLELPVLDLLTRVRATASQVSLDRRKRRENMAGAFGIKHEIARQVAGKTIFLVDDVLTSGATLLEAAKILKQNGARSVYGLTLAHGN